MSLCSNDAFVCTYIRLENIIVHVIDYYCYYYFFLCSNQEIKYENYERSNSPLLHPSLLGAASEKDFVSLLFFQFCSLKSF